MTRNSRLALRTALAASVLFAGLGASRIASAADADRPAAAPAASPASTSSDHGVVGTLSLTRPMALGSSGSDVDKGCGALGSQCNSANEGGGGFMFSTGYTWRYIGFDVLAGASLDGSTRSYVDASGASKSYAMERVGGFAAVRMRGTLQTNDLRVSLAVGPGAAYRLVGMSSEYLGSPGDGNKYGSLALSADLSVSWRLSRTTALSAGAMLWMESAGQDVKMHVGLPSAGMPPKASDLVAASSRDLVSGVQTMLLPYIGLTFGP